jgi:hypothetical protein
MGKLEHGAEDRDRLLRPKPPSPRITMDPGFRRGDGERGSHGILPNSLVVGSVESRRRDSFAALPLTAFPAKAGTQGPGSRTYSKERLSGTPWTPACAGEAETEKQRFQFHPLIQGGASPTIPMTRLPPG